jgi:short-subunit dehydrogenase
MADKNVGVALITGASSGIGKEIALELARRGWKLGLTARREKELEEVAEAARAAGAEAEIHLADVADRASVDAAAAAIEKRFGRVDLLIANAGIGLPPASKEKVLDAAAVDAVEKTFRVNFFGVVYAINAVLPGMLARGTGHIAAVSSLVAYHGLPRAGAYCASKAAVNSFLESLRLDLLNRNIAVTIVNPGFVDTPLTQKNKFKMPMLVDAARAGRIIVDGLARRKRLIEFPYPMAAAMKIGRLVPDWVFEKLVAGKGF